MRERLVELLKETRCEKSCDGFKNIEVCKGCTAYERYAESADHLLANGVIVPPFEIGTRVYVVVSRTSNNKNLYIVEDVITHYRIFDDCMIMCFVEHLGLPDYKWGNVFLTKEKAEQALNNVQNGNSCEGGAE